MMDKTRLGGLIGAVVVGAAVLGGCARPPEPDAAALEAAHAAVPPVTQAAFDAEVVNAGQPVLVDAYADWCGPCKLMAPEVAKVAQQLEGRVKVVRLDVDEAPDISAQYNIQGIPNLLLFKDGELEAQWVGYHEAGKLIERVERQLTG